MSIKNLFKNFMINGHGIGNIPLEHDKSAISINQNISNENKHDE